MHRSVLPFLLIYLVAVILALTSQTIAAPLIQNHRTIVWRGTRLLENSSPIVDETQNIVPRQYVSQKTHSDGLGAHSETGGDQDTWHVTFYTPSPKDRHRGGAGPPKTLNACTGLHGVQAFTCWQQQQRNARKW